MGSEVLGNLLGQLVMGLSLTLYQLKLGRGPILCRDINDTSTLPPEQAVIKVNQSREGAFKGSGHYW